MLAVGAISRVQLSLTVSPALTFGICALLFLINILAQYIYSKDLKPHWSYYIEMYEEKVRAKEAGEEPKQILPLTPQQINPLSPHTLIVRPNKKTGSKRAIGKEINA